MSLVWTLFFITDYYLVSTCGIPVNRYLKIPVCRSAPMEAGGIDAPPGEPGDYE
jgi:hypothetical protein